jgi:hypothetical protein
LVRGQAFLFFVFLPFDEEPRAKQNVLSRRSACVMGQARRGRRGVAYLFCCWVVPAQPRLGRLACAGIAAGIVRLELSSACEDAFLQA